jgi:acetyl-CoA/propionyl-CoA carboxylase biotin carboxyl carrier protein
LVHLGDRDCSVQRRHQKLLEEAPAPGLSDVLRGRLADAALALCRSVGYFSAGTVEFLVDPASDAFYFLEMNPRLQVEHGVTELVTGIDLVRQQIRVAAGEALDFTQADVRVYGHAMQARIAAEDPWAGFRPVAGEIRYLALPLGPWLRLDFGVESGDAIQQHYDSMFGKVQAWGRSREEARARLGTALDALVVEGLPTTAPYLRCILEQRDFLAATHDTGSLERDWVPDPATKPAPPVRPSSATRRDPTSPRRSERRVSVPWGGELIDVAVYGVVDGTAGGAVAANAREARAERQLLEHARPSDSAVLAPMDAVVVAFAAEVGGAVSRGTPLLVLEAMKMEVVIYASTEGTLEQFFVAPGESVRTGARLAAVRASAR